LKALAPYIVYASYRSHINTIFENNTLTQIIQLQQQLDQQLPSQLRTAANIEWSKHEAMLLYFSNVTFNSKNDNSLLAQFSQDCTQMGLSEQEKAIVIAIVINAVNNDSKIVINDIPITRTPNARIGLFC
jgi:hypothetical protein